MTSPFTWSTTTPADTDIVAQYPALARARQATLGASSATGGVLGTLAPTTGGGTPTVGWRAVQDADELWAALNAWYNGTLWAQDNTAKESYALHYSPSGTLVEILRMRAGQTTWETMLRIPVPGTGQIVNYAQITPAPTGSQVQYAVVGSDPNLDVVVVPKGTGSFRVGIGNTFISDGTNQGRISTNNANRTRMLQSMATVYLGGTQSIPSGSFTVINWDSALANTDSMWSSSAPSRLTAPITGKYLITGTVFAPTAISGQWQSALLRNGSVILYGTTDSAASAYAPCSNFSIIYPLNAGDYVQCELLQVSGSSVSLGAGGSVNNFGMLYVGE